MISVRRLNLKWLRLARIILSAVSLWTTRLGATKSSMSLKDDIGSPRGRAEHHRDIEEYVARSDCVRNRV